MRDYWGNRDIYTIDTIIEDAWSGWQKCLRIVLPKMCLFGWLPKTRPSGGPMKKMERCGAEGSVCCDSCDRCFRSCDGLAVY